MVRTDAEQLEAGLNILGALEDEDNDAIYTSEKPRDPITLRYVDLTALPPSAFVMEIQTTEHYRRKMMRTLNIEVPDDETCAEAWLRTMCEENDIEYSTPVCADMSNAVAGKAFQFYFFLI
jgi:hypothetical protein